jgi:hypothetical protein
MTLDTVIILFGAFVAVLPFLQFPPGLTTWLTFIAGLIIVGLGIIVRRRGLGRKGSDRSQRSVAPGSAKEGTDEAA